MPLPDRPTPRTRRAGPLLVALVLAAAVLTLGLASPRAGAAAPPHTTPIPAAGAPGASVVDNEFIPRDVDLSQCISANPRPGCGSENRSGWRQYLLLAALVVGVAVIGWRITAAVRARDRALSGH